MVNIKYTRNRFAWAVCDAIFAMSVASLPVAVCVGIIALVQLIKIS